MIRARPVAIAQLSQLKLRYIVRSDGIRNASYFQLENCTTKIAANFQSINKKNWLPKPFFSTDTSNIQLKLLSRSTHLEN